MHPKGEVTTLYTTIDLIQKLNYTLSANRKYHENDDLIFDA
jgi:hypothetical protein